MRTLLLFSFIFMTSLLPLHAQNRAQPVDGFAAEVDGVIITVGDVIEQIRPQLMQLRKESKGAAFVQKQAELFNDGLEKQIEQKLMLAQFNKVGAELPAGMVRERKDLVIRERFDGSQQAFIEALRQVGKTEKDWEDEMMEQMITQSMVQQFVRGQINVSPREIRERYEMKKYELQQDTELKLYAIAFRPALVGGEQERLEKIQNVMKLLAEGADFSETALRYSEGPSASKGGDEGWVNLSSLPDVLKLPLLEAEVGDITPLIETPVQSYIFKVEDRRGGETQTVEQAQALLTKEIEQEKYREIYDSWMEGLRDQFQVRRFNPDLSAVTGDQ
ncbi:peptidyl-prolyl cis-trans isomerase [Kiritimatiellota bacterium B12222]|nr:peptidyl-prolyl cis-trans isomerase [Kiritimatiellota bacterium B12222]